MVIGHLKQGVLNDCNPNEAERLREELVQKLMQVKQTDLVGRCVELVKASDWIIMQGVDKTQRRYEDFSEVKLNNEKID